MSSIRSDIDRPPSRAVDAAEALASALASGPGPLPPAFRERLLRAIADGRIEASDAKEAALSAFALRLARQPLTVGAGEVEELRVQAAASDEEILEAVLMAGLAVLRRTLDAGIGRACAWDQEQTGAGPEPRPGPVQADATRRPTLSAPVRRPGEFAPFDLLRERLGFVPALYKAQTLLPEALESEIRALCEILLDDGRLPRRLKELALLAVSAANANTYCVAVHGEILRSLGVPPEQSDAIAHDPLRPGLAEDEKALVDAAVGLATRPEDCDPAATPESLEVAAVAALTGFLNTIERGLNPRPDFRPRRDLLAERVEAEKARAAAAAEAASDPDAGLVALAREGDDAAFEQLVRRHQARVYRTVAGVTGSPEDAEDGTQAVFVRVFRKLSDFSGASRFSTWLTRIAIHEGIDLLRRRRPAESLENDAEEPDFRPSSLSPWIDDPERLYARDEMRRLVREKLATLPERYRVAVFLRDIEQLSTSEAAEALDVPVATLKTRLLRGRLMMREALAPLFDAGAKGGRGV
ncbi:MAG TPA: sigma-70 family RNA polymerase sigma factor [Thermoanaerobaculia bacterium]|jgi:RNA polymerase sigma-70 factor (ECF subfamily)